MELPEEERMSMSGQQAFIGDSQSYAGAARNAAPLMRETSLRMADGGSANRHNLLARAIESEVIPRLVLAQRSMPGLRAKGAATALLVNDVAEFAGLVLTRDQGAVDGFVSERRARGSDIESIYLDLLAPTALRFGAMWEDDRLSFADVTIGLGRLQQAMRSLSHEFEADAVRVDRTKRVLLAPAPGNQHSFGLFMVAEFFRNARWDVWTTEHDSSRELLRMVRGEWFAVVGFSVGAEGRLDLLANAINAVRRASRNRSIGVMVGGPMFVQHPELAMTVGADVTAADGRQAVVQAQNLLALLPRQR